MGQFVYIDQDVNFEIIGEQEGWVIPGNLEEILEWMRTATVAVTSRYQRYFIHAVERTSGNLRYFFPGGGIIYLDILDNNRPAFAFHDFREGINNSVTFRLIYDAKTKYDAFMILCEMGMTARADWAQRVKAIWEKIPPSGHSTWLESREVTPGRTEQIYAYFEGPPPEWQVQELPITLALQTTYREFIDWFEKEYSNIKLNYQPDNIIEFEFKDPLACQAKMRIEKDGENIKIDGACSCRDSGKWLQVFEQRSKNYFGEVGQAEKPPELPKWKRIVPNKGDNWQILELWGKNHTNSEIAERLHKVPRTITNRISALRLRYPDADILTDNKRRKSLQKS